MGKLMNEYKTILVTGGCGFIGSNYINKYSKYYNIHTIDCLTYASSLNNIDWNVFPKSNFHKINLLWYTELDELFKKLLPDVVINFAAETHVDNSISDPLVFTPANIMGTHNLLELSTKYQVKKYIQISTDEVYGHLDNFKNSFIETDNIFPRNPYSATKAAADLLVGAYYTTYGLNTCISRCSNNFGPNQHQEKLIPKIILNAMKNIQIPVYGTGENIRHWIYVEDHIDGINAIMEYGKPGEIYNFGGNNSEFTNIEIVKQILNNLGKPESLIIFVEDRKGHDFRYAIDYSKASKELQWYPKWNFNDALVKTIDFYRYIIK